MSHDINLLQSQRDKAIAAQQYAESHADRLEEELNLARKALRDDYASAALSGLIVVRKEELGKFVDYGTGRVLAVVYEAWQIADAMLKERDKEAKP